MSTVNELAEVLDAELAKLPDRFRDVILLSLVEGLTREEISDRLGISMPAVKDRLERGRDQLRSRLVRRGITLSAATLAAWFVPGTAHAASMTTLVASTAKAGGAFAAGSLTTSSLTSGTSLALAQGILKVMGFEKVKSGLICLVGLLTAGGVAYGMLQDDPARFEKGLRGHIVLVQPVPLADKPASITIALEESGTLLNLDISQQVTVQLAFQSAFLADLKIGQYASLGLGDDHRTVIEIDAQGMVREGAIGELASTDKITLFDDDNADGEARLIEVQLAPDAILRIGGLPATRKDLPPGTELPLEFDRDGKIVNAIELEALENSLIYGQLVEIDAANYKITVSGEDDEAERMIQQTFLATAETIVLLDDQRVTLADLKTGCGILLRLSIQGETISAIKATSPTPEEQEDESGSESESESP